jgi:FkbM family methyltransferase
MERCIPDARAVFKSQRGGCSSVPWAERLADAVPSRRKPVTYVNVGANKGYRIPEFLGLWSQRPVLGYMKAWQKQLLRYADAHNFRYLKRFSCGNCGDCNGVPPAPHNRSGARMHLFELATANRALLTYMLDATKLTNRVQLHPFAASNVTQEMTVFKGLYAGDERGSALVGKKAYRLQKGNATETVRAVALDDFFQEKRLRDLYHVAIDTEGWDALVVEGMRQTLAERRVAILEFEVNSGGMWSSSCTRCAGKRTVNGTLTLLHAAGYACFWVLTKTLLPASGPCWLPEFGGKLKWSNIVCAHEPPLIRALDAMAREEYASRAAAAPSPSSGGVIVG